MAYRSIFIKDTCNLKLKNNQLYVLKENKEITMPLEDISIILIENQETVITTALLGQLANYNIGVIFCDLKHMPSSILLPMNNHYKQLSVFEKQMEIKKPVLSQCWQKIIFYKIINQKYVLEELNKNDYFIEKLDILSKDIKSADNTNREAVAAKLYFEGLFGAMFQRNRNNDDAINCALNYGYTILFSNMARLLSMYGFNTILGIHHCSYVNNYNLASDMMEPFRPMVDRYVARNLDNLEYPLTTQNKKELVDILHMPMRINGANYLLEHAMEEMVLSLIKVYDKNDSSLLECPNMIQSSQELEIEDV